LVAVLANVIAITIAEATVAPRPRLLDAVYRPVTMVLLLAGFSLLLLVADRVRGNPLAAMGLGREHWGSQFALGLALGAGMICIAIAGIALGGHLSFSMVLTRHAFAVSGLEVLILATGALVEELMFRGYPFQRLVEGVGAVGAVLILSALFGLMHLGNPHSSLWALINTIAVGVVFSVAYLRTRSLWLPLGMHFAWNTALGMGFGLPVSGLTEFATVIKGNARGPTWLTGGAYGIEASALGTVVIVLGLLALLLTTRSRGSDREPIQAAVPAAGNWEHTQSSDQPPLPRIQP
jgi:membrane protease YdiL (CAAX protease family)